MTIPASIPEPAVVQPTPFLDRRSDERLAVCVPVRILYVSGRRVSYDGSCTNISTSGAAVEINGTMQVGDVIDFEFRNTDDIPAIHRARVLYRDGNRYGMYFLNVY